MTTTKAKAIIERLRAHAADASLTEELRERAERLAETVERKLHERRAA